VVEFENGQKKLAAEITDQEITWSQSSPVAADQVRAWFGQQVQADKEGADDGSISANKFIFLLLALNAIPLLLSGSSWFIVGLAVLVIYLPARYLNSMDKDKP
jgi:hypothetical protein